MSGSIVKVTIDGRDFTANLQRKRNSDFELTLSRDNEYGAALFVLSSELVFEGDAYNYLNNRFFTTAAACTQESTVTILTNCCDLEFTFYANAETISVDLYNCEATIALLQDSPASRAFNRLRTKPFWGDKDSEFVQSVTHPRIVYCEAISLLDRLVNALPFTRTRTGCNGEYHPSPIVHKILEWNAAQVGLEFRSDTIFELYPEYKRMALLMAQYRDGARRTENVNWIEENAPILTTTQLLEKLTPVFNARFEVTSTELRFETKKWFRQQSNVLFDLEREINAARIATGLSATYDTSGNFAYGRFAYAQDPIDVFGNRAHGDFSDIVEWNPDGSHCLRREYANLLEFSATHFTKDRHWWRVLGGQTFRENDLRNLTPGSLMLTNGMSGFLKIILLEQGFDINDARPVTETFLPKPGYPITFNRFNMPLMFDENRADGLYQRFHAESAPTTRPVVSVGNVEWRPRDFCEAMDAITANGLRLCIATPWGSGQAETLRVNFDQKTITLDNVKVYGS